MPEKSVKELRMAEFLNPVDGQSLILDTTIAGSNGYTGELLDAKKTIPEAASVSDGIILNPGQHERISDLLPGKHGAATMIRLDWTNVFRGQDFPLGCQKEHRVMIAQPEDALYAGASCAVVYFLLGFDEDFESDNITDIAECARKCSDINLPLIIDLRLCGPKIGPKNKNSAVKLGTGIMVEGGADGIIIPCPDEDTFATLLEFSPVPLFLHGSVDPENSQKSILEDRLLQGASGICMGRDIYNNELEYTAKELSENLLKKVHQLGSES